MPSPITGARPSVNSDAAYLGWVVRPETRCVESLLGDDVLPEIAELHAAHGAKLFRRRNMSYAKKLEMIPVLDDSQLMACAKLEHELDHIQRHCSSSYGFLIHRLHSHRIHLFFERVKQSQARDELRFPIFGSVDPGTGGDAWSATHREFIQAGFALKVLECMSGAPRVPSIMQQSDAESVLQRIVGPFHSLATASNSPWLIQEAGTGAFPVIKAGSQKPQKVGGQGLLEYLAVSREATVLRYAGLGHLLDHDLMRSHVHSQAGLMWKHWAGLPMPMRENLSPGWTSAGVSAGPSFPIECWLAVDLALWPPFVPEGWSPSERGWTWFDIQPGWRFARILEYFKTLDLRFRLFLTEQDIASDWMLDLQSKVCEHFGWPTPHELAGVWRTYWEGVARGSEGRPLFIQDDQERAEATVELLATRLRDPFRFVLSYPGSEGRRSHWFQAVTTWIPRPSGQKELVMRSLDGQEERWGARGYRLPAAFAVTKGVELFGTVGWPADRGPVGPIREELKSIGRGLELDLRVYGHRHHGVLLEFGGRVPS